jgi:predicted amidophosphoribosyltransferase
MDWRPLLDFVFPAQWASCNAIGSGLCNACRPNGKPVAVYLPSLRVAAVAAYEGALRAAVLALKDGRRDVAEALGHITAPLVPAGATLVPVPTTVKRRRVTLFDDVCTTGSTLRDCADAIREAGGVVDDAIVVAVAKSPHPWSNSIAR